MARRRHQLVAADVRIYRFLSSALLNDRDFRPVKQLYVARRVGLSRSFVGESLQRLNVAGLLERKDVGYRTATALYRLREYQR